MTHIFYCLPDLSTKTSLNKCSNMFICQHIISIKVRNGIRFLLCLICITIKHKDTLRTLGCHVIKDGDNVGSVAHFVRGYDVCHGCPCICWSEASVTSVSQQLR